MFRATHRVVFGVEGFDAKPDIAGQMPSAHCYKQSGVFIISGCGSWRIRFK
jgi:hypothetical protein